MPTPARSYRTTARSPIAPLPSPDGPRPGERNHPGTRRAAALSTPVPADVVEEAAHRLRVLGHPLRLRVLDTLASGPHSVSDLGRLLDVEHQLVSKHLSELLRAGVVRRQQEGNFALYSLPDALTIKAVALLCRSVADDRARLARLATSAESPPDVAAP